MTDNININTLSFFFIIRILSQSIFDTYLNIIILDTADNM